MRLSTTGLLALGGLPVPSVANAPSHAGALWLLRNTIAPPSLLHHTGNSGGVAANYPRIRGIASAGTWDNGKFASARINRFLATTENNISYW